MTKAKARVLKAIQETGYYKFSSDSAERDKERQSVKELKQEGIISSCSMSLGEVYAKLS